MFFPSNLVGIAGPNGCGKSNIIDAIRWVMGESSARHLRGESMTDVIFNGSKHRKAVGQASVEMVFSNNNSMLTGAYASYQELSVKRSVARDGQAVYTINGTRCRKRDVAEIFLGTGLGSRSYAIISQGMISQIIEAKPDQLRMFFEEAAGISKYKAKRRETELRMADCQENLQRVGDLRNSLSEQVNRLKRQAAAAEKYQALVAEQRLLQQQLFGLEWQQLAHALTTAQQQRQQNQQNKTQATEVLAQTEVELKSQRQCLDELNQALSRQQTTVFEKKQAVADLAHQQMHVQTETKRVATAIEDKQQRRIQLSQQYQQDKQSHQQCVDAILALAPKLDAAIEQRQQLEQQRSQTEQYRSQCQVQVDASTKTLNDVNQSLTVEQTKQHEWQQVDAQAQLRQSQLAQRCEQLQALLADDQVVLSQQTKVEQAQQQLGAQKQQLSEQTSALKQQKAALAELEQLRHEQRIMLTSITAQQASLIKLQEAALQKDQPLPQDWLSHHGLSHTSRLGELLDVQPGYELAVEVVLASLLSAIPAPAPINDFIKGIGDVRVPLVSQTDALDSDGTANDTQCRVSLPRLIEKLRSPSQAMVTLLTNVYIADDLDQALAHLSSLPTQASIITPQGTWMASHWWRPFADDCQSESVLARQRQVSQLASQRQQLEETLADKDHAIAQCQQTIEQLEESQTIGFQRLEAQQSTYSESKAELRLLENQREQAAQRLQSLQNELSEVKQAQYVRQQLLIQSQQRVQAFIQDLAKTEEERDLATAQLAEISAAMATIQAEFEQVNHCCQEYEWQRRSQENDKKSLAEVIKRGEVQLADLDNQIEVLLEEQSQLAQLDTEATVAKLAEARDSQKQAQQGVTDVNASITTIKQQIDVLERQHYQQQQILSDCQQHLEQQQLACQSLLMRQQHIEENYAKLDAPCTLATTVKKLPAETNDKELSASLSSIVQKIQRLGAINLAAVDEHHQLSKEKMQLDEQVNDLESALALLEQAIATIDRETCHRFKETFDQVNDSFEKLFPTLFGGGSAYLAMTSESLLDAGVTVMARPPGKRNATIHLLSGGEKALTAVALVFAIFQLNPSPFCLLDEVDAPLDDANVGRFCQLLEMMSSQVQFIFISHNKSTLAIANQLVGVTMSEPGVSRTVSVDVEQAVGIAS